MLLFALAAATVLFGGSAGAQIAFKACPKSDDLACGRLTVPLNPAEPAGKTIQIAIQRHRAPVGAASTAVIALAGGPGQAAIPFTETFEEVLGPILATRDLIVFDQRGTGVSHPLKCKAFERESSGSAAAAVRRCAEQIGSQRAFYTSLDTVADIEAIRVAGGYEKLVLYGTSYGTKVALEYAQQHPSHVEALILDSVVSPNGPETLDLPTFKAIPRVLRQLCQYKDCAGITSKPVSNLEALVERIGNGALHARVIGPTGQARTVAITSEDLVNVLIDGDLDPILRAEYLAAVRSALLGDTAALGRLIARTESGSEESGSDGIDVPLYYATSCEEQLFPWNRTKTPSERFAEAQAKIAALPKHAFAPFARTNVLATSDIRECADWPFATPAPAINDEPLPAVPTVILSGADDTRTPTSGARAIAAKIPGSHVVVVPNTGHSVLTTEPGTCALKAVRALFAKRPIRGCKREAPSALYRPTPIAPRRLSSVAPFAGYAGTAGRTLDAVGLTLADALRQIVLDVLEGDGSTAAGSTSLQVGGLRGGWARLSPAGVELHDYSYVPGVTVTGHLGAHTDKLTVGGSAAARGTLREGRGKALVGRLGSTPVRLPARKSGDTASAARFDGRERQALAALGGKHATDALAALDGTLSQIHPAQGSSLLSALTYALSHHTDAEPGGLLH